MIVDAQTLDSLALAVAQRCHAACAELFDLPETLGTAPLTRLELDRLAAALGIAQAVLDTSRSQSEATRRMAALRPITWRLTDPQVELPQN